jgi:hypothetical protein
MQPPIRPHNLGEIPHLFEIKNKQHKTTSQWSLFFQHLRTIFELNTYLLQYPGVRTTPTKALNQTNRCGVLLVIRGDVLDEAYGPTIAKLR